MWRQLHDRLSRTLSGTPSPPSPGEIAADRPALARRVVIGLAAVALVAAAALLAARAPDIIRSAFVGNKSDPSNTVGAITQAVKGLDDDALPIVGALTPLTIVIGAVSMFMGSRRGLTIMVSTGAALILIVGSNGLAS